MLIKLFFCAKIFRKLIVRRGDALRLKPDMKNNVLAKITNIAALLDILGAIAMFITQIVDAVSKYGVSSAPMLVVLIISTVLILSFFIQRLNCVIKNCDSNKLLTISAYVVDAAWIVAVIFLLKSLNVF